MFTLLRRLLSLWKSGALYVGIAVLVGLGGYTLWLRHLVVEAQGEVRTSQLTADSLVAVHDTTVRRWLADSTAVFSRRSLQLQQHADSLDRLLGVVRQANLDLTVSLRSYTGTLAAVAVVDSQSHVRSAVFQLRQLPYTIHAVAHLADPPTPSTLDLSVSLDRLALVVRLACGSTKTRGREFHSATVVVTTPPWASADIESVSQSPEVCNPQPPSSRGSTGSFWPTMGKVLTVVGVVLGAGLVIH